MKPDSDLTVEELEERIETQTHTIEMKLQLRHDMIEELSTKRATAAQDALANQGHDPITVARLLSSVQERYHATMVKEMNSIEPMKLDVFWTHVSALRALFAQSDHPAHRRAWILDNYCWQYLNDSQWSVETWQMLVSFSRRWSKVDGELSKALFEVPGVEKGDDAYSDWTEMLVLLGRDFYRKAIAGGVHHADDIRKKVYFWTTKLECTPTQKDAFFEFIWHGENYIAMTLDKRLAKFYLQVAQDRNGVSDA